MIHHACCTKYYYWWYCLQWNRFRPSHHVYTVLKTYFHCEIERSDMFRSTSWHVVLVVNSYNVYYTILHESFVKPNPLWTFIFKKKYIYNKNEMCSYDTHAPICSLGKWWNNFGTIKAVLEMKIWMYWYESNSWIYLYRQSNLPRQPPLLSSHLY